MTTATRKRSDLLAFLREEREFHDVLDVFNMLLMRQLDDTLIPEVIEIAGRDAAFALLDLLAGETLVFPEAGVLEALVRKAAVYRSLCGISQSPRPDRRTSAWKNEVARQARLHEVSRATIRAWFDEVYEFLGGVEL